MQASAAWVAELSNICYWGKRYQKWKLASVFIPEKIVVSICCYFNKSACVDRGECRDVDVSSEVVGNSRNLGVSKVLTVRLTWKLWNSDLNPFYGHGMLFTVIEVCLKIILKKWCKIILLWACGEFLIISMYFAWVNSFVFWIKMTKQKKLK